jgi:hypothetical protein
LTLRRKVDGAKPTKSRGCCRSDTRRYGIYFSFAHAFHASQPFCATGLMVSFERNDRRRSTVLRTSSSEPYRARSYLAGCIARKAHNNACSLPQFYGSAADKLRGLADRLPIVSALDHGRGRGDVTVSRRDVDAVMRHAGSDRGRKVVTAFLACVGPVPARRGSFSHYNC